MSFESRSRLRRYNGRFEVSSEEPTSSEPSSEEPSSEESITESINKDASKILWISNTAWYTWSNQIGYPRPQGNIPMLLTLKPQKQESLLRAYFSVYGNSADHVNKEWKPNDN